MYIMSVMYMQRLSNVAFVSRDVCAVCKTPNVSVESTPTYIAMERRYFFGVRGVFVCPWGLLENVWAAALVGV